VRGGRGRKEGRGKEGGGRKGEGGGGKGRGRGGGNQFDIASTVTQK